MLEAIVIAVVGAVLGMMGTYWAGRQTRELDMQKFRQDMRAEYDRTLRSNRIDQYKTLWRLTGLLPQYARDEAVTYAAVHQLSIALRKWYFEKGGMFLTDGSRDTYFAVQGKISEVLAAVPESAWPHTVLPPEVYESVRVKCSSLRSQMVKDVGTRSESPLN